MPESAEPDVVARFSREGSLLLGGGRAILLQVADPVVGAAVAEHSDFANRPLDRLRNTLTFVYGTMLGSPAEAAFVARMTRRAHERIPLANEPDRQLWVAATLYETAMRVYERAHAPISHADAELVLASYAALGTALEVPASHWPATVADFDRYWKDAVAALDVGDDARRVARDLFHPARAPLWLRAVLPLTELLTASLLEPTLRTAYGMPWGRARERRASVAWGVIRVLVRLLPRLVRYWPSRRYLRRLGVVLSRAS